MPRAQNAHAYVNAGFLYEIRDNQVVSARVCFGGITPNFVHATKTENLLIGTDIHKNETLQLALQQLAQELVPDWELPDASPEYRKNLALSLFYKSILSTCPSSRIGAEFMSGSDILHRPVSSGTQTFDTHKDKWPLTQPVLKYEGMIQSSGEAKYTNDLPYQNGELWAAFVPAYETHSRVHSIDASIALVSCM